MDPTDSLPALTSQSGFAGNFYLRNVEALSAAAQATASGTLSFAQQQAEAVRSMFQQSAKAYGDVIGEQDPKEVVRKAFDALREWMQNATALSNILSELSARNAADAARIIQDRAYAALGEMQSFAATVIDAQPSIGIRH
jgi:phasin family protein